MVFFCIFVQNFIMVGFKKTLDNYKSGFVTLLGRPNVGKSTLINKLIGEKITITSPVPQTTRNNLKGILTTKVGQIIFVDTPGVHKPHHRLGEILVKNAKGSINGVDIVIFVLDVSKEPGRGDKYIKDFLVNNKKEFLIALNKWDLLEQEFRNLRIEQYRKFFGDNKNFQIVSATEGKGCSELIEIIFDSLPRGPKLYDQDVICDQPLSYLLSDLVREQVLKYTKEEVPHSVAVKIEVIKEMKKNNGKSFTAILATIIVERDSQKGILIGKKGSMLKNIGKSARFNMTSLINGAVHLELFVKVVPNWRKKESKLIEFGYEEES
jgi:GTP-binding protein Era